MPVTRWKGSKAGKGGAALARTVTHTGRGVRVGAPPAAENRSGLPWMSGFSTPGDGNITQKHEFETFRSGRLGDSTTLFMGGDFFSKPNYSYWNNNYVCRAGGIVNDVMDADYLVALSVPLLLGFQAGEFVAIRDAMASVTSAEYLAHKNVADSLYEHVASDRIYIRLGWEANKGYAWSLADNNVLRPQTQLDAYPLAWARVAQVYKDRLPGVKMIWNHLPDPNAGLYAGNYFPGLAVNSIVDCIGCDLYDIDGRYSTLAEWNEKYGSYTTTGAQAGLIKGIGGHLAFARAKGIKLTSEEWGPFNMDYDNTSGSATYNIDPDPNQSNNEFFCRRMCQFFNDNADDIEFENFYNKGGQHQIHPQVRWLPAARTGYFESYRDVAAVP